MGFEQFAQGVQSGMAPGIQQGFQQQAADKNMARDLQKLKKVQEMQFKAKQMADAYQFSQNFDRMSQALGTAGADPSMAGLFATGINPAQAGIQFGSQAELEKLRLEQAQANLELARQRTLGAKQDRIGAGQDQRYREANAQINFLKMLQGKENVRTGTEFAEVGVDQYGNPKYQQVPVYGSTPAQPGYQEGIQDLASLFGINIPQQQAQSSLSQYILQAHGPMSLDQIVNMARQNDPQALATVSTIQQRASAGDPEAMQMQEAVSRSAINAQTAGLNPYENYQSSGYAGRQMPPEQPRGQGRTTGLEGVLGGIFKGVSNVFTGGEPETAKPKAATPKEKGAKTALDPKIMNEWSTVAKKAKADDADSYSKIQELIRSAMAGDKQALDLVTELNKKNIL